MAQTEQQWAQGFLSYIGAPATGPNDARVQWLTAWANMEGTFSQGNPNNPLDTTNNMGMQADGEGNYNANNGFPVQTYDDPVDGYKALVAYLQPNSDVGILNALRDTHATTDSLYNAVVASNWNGGGQGGAESIRVANAIRANLNGGSPAPGSPVANDTPVAVVNGYGPTNFHGFDLSTIPDTAGPGGGNLLAQAEQGILKYAGDPQAGQLLVDRIQQDYGFMSWALADPQVKGLVIAASETGFGKNLFISLLQSTNWWKTHNENQRAWQQIAGNDAHVENGQVVFPNATDPATALQLVNEARAKVVDTANQMGVTLDPSHELAMALTLAANTATQSGTFVSPGHYGWTQEQIDLMVSGAYKYRPGQTPFGLAGSLVTQYQNLAGEYMVPMSLDTIGKAVQQDFHNRYTMQGSFEQGAESGFEQSLKQQAATLFPTLATGIKAGLTPYQMTEPYRQMVGQTLEVAPDTVNLSGGQYRWMIDQPTPDGKRQMMSLSDAQTRLMSDPKYGYQHTQQARQTAYQIVDELGRSLGALSQVF